MSKEVWIISEVRNNKFRDVSFELLAWGRSLADSLNVTLCAVVLTDKLNDGEMERLAAYGADKVYFVCEGIFQRFINEPFSAVLAYLVRRFEPEIVLAAATTTGRTLLPYVASKIRTGLTADCTTLEIDDTTKELLQIRPAIGGNILATIRTPNHRPQMATVRPKSIAVPEPQSGRTVEVYSPDIPVELFRSVVTIDSFKFDDTGASSLDSAEIIVSGGLGMSSPEGFCLVAELAETLGGAVGSSRPPVDHGWKPYTLQIGLSGKSVSPELYFACGVSGAMQHLAGIQTAKNIAAINCDSEAAIFQVADFGIVGDVNIVIPAIVAKINEIAKK